MRARVSFLLLLSAFGLSACLEGASDLERAAIGGAIGCAAGEIIEDGECITGAAIGAAGGALINDI